MKEKSLLKAVPLNLIWNIVRLIINLQVTNVVQKEIYSQFHSIFKDIHFVLIYIIKDNIFESNIFFWFASTYFPSPMRSKDGAQVTFPQRDVPYLVIGGGILMTARQPITIEQSQSGVLKCPSH